MEWLFLSPRKACHLLPKPFPKEPLLLELNNNGKVTEDKKKKENPNNKNISCGQFYFRAKENNSGIVWGFILTTCQSS